MKKTIIIILFLILFFQVIYIFSDNECDASIIVSGGINWGNITSNGEIDAVTSASKKTGGNVSIHNEFNLFGHFLETGLDYVHFVQDWDYLDDSEDIDGTRSFAMQFISLPLFYNFHFFNSDSGNPRLVLGLGLFFSFILHSEILDSGELPDYDLKDWTAGANMRISFYPFEIEERFVFGLFINFFRSFNQLYTDNYHMEMFEGGEIGTIDFGLSVKYNF